MKPGGQQNLIRRRWGAEQNKTGKRPGRISGMPFPSVLIMTELIRRAKGSNGGNDAASMESRSKNMSPSSFHACLPQSFLFTGKRNLFACLDLDQTSKRVSCKKCARKGMRKSSGSFSCVCSSQAVGSFFSPDGTHKNVCMSVGATPQSPLPCGIPVAAWS